VVLAVIIKKRTGDITGASAQANSIMWTSIRYAVTDPFKCFILCSTGVCSSSSGDVFKIGMEVMSANVDLMGFHSGTSGKPHASKSV
jgi:hypothetical protein